MMLAPNDTRFRYVYAVALHSAGRVAEAQVIIKAGLQQAPGDPGLKELRAGTACRLIRYHQRYGAAMVLLVLSRPTNATFK